MGRVRQVSLDPRRTKRVFECLYYHGKDLCMGCREMVCSTLSHLRGHRNMPWERRSADTIYLHALDKYIETTYLSLTEGQRARRRKRGKGNFLYVRYADDFVVLCNGTKAETQAMKKELGEFLSTMGLTLSEEKTKVTHITEGFDFLGYRVIRQRGTKGNMVPKVLVPKKAIDRFRSKLREMLARHTAEESIGLKIQKLNWLTRGWCEYYRSTSGPSKVFKEIAHELFWDFAHWLGRKYDSNMPAIMRRFR